MGERKTLEAIRQRLQDVMPFLAKEYQVESLAVFGSYVRAEQDQQSDLDLLVTFEISPGLLRYIELESYLSKMLDLQVDLVMKAALKPRIGERILREIEPV